MNAQQLETLFLEVGAGNFGAMRVCQNLVDALGALALADLECLREADITGSEVWYLYKDACGQDLDRMHAALMEQKAIELLAGNRYSKFYQQPTSPQEA